MVILGIDPGLQRVGYGVIRKDGGKIAYIDAGILKTSHKSYRALQEIKSQIDALIRKHKPEILALEKLYFGRNQKTGIGVAQSQGVILLAASERDVDVIEYAPNEVKGGVAGYGFADKKTIARVVQMVLHIAEKSFIDDATDALAIALLASGDRLRQRLRN